MKLTILNQYNTLKVIQVFCIVAHIIVLALNSWYQNIKNTSVPVYHGFPTGGPPGQVHNVTIPTMEITSVNQSVTLCTWNNQSVVNGVCEYQLHTRIGYVHIFVLEILVEIVTILEHLFVLYRIFFLDDFRLGWIAKNYNGYRWVSFGLSSTMMIILLTTILGTNSLQSLLAHAICNFVMIVHGWIINKALRNYVEAASVYKKDDEEFMPKPEPLGDPTKWMDGTRLITRESTTSTKEEPNPVEEDLKYRREQIWTSFIIASIIGFVPWLCIFVGFGFLPGIPPILISILVFLFVQFSIFGLIEYWHIQRVFKHGKFNLPDQIRNENLYAMLSLTSKVSLGIQCLLIPV